MFPDLNNSQNTFCYRKFFYSSRTILLIKITAAQKEVTLSYYKVCELYFLPVIFAATILFTVR